MAETTNFNVPKVAGACSLFQCSLFFPQLHSASQCRKLKSWKLFDVSTNLMTDYGHWSQFRNFAELRHDEVKKNFCIALKPIEPHQTICCCLLLPLRSGDKWLLINQQTNETQIKHKNPNDKLSLRRLHLFFYYVCSCYCCCCFFFCVVYNNNNINAKVDDKYRQTQSSYRRNET